jgi:hypothetical protein
MPRRVQRLASNAFVFGSGFHPSSVVPISATNHFSEIRHPDGRFRGFAQRSSNSDSEVVADVYEG